MKKDLIENMIPVETIDKKIWYIDITNLSLSELITLKNELINKSVMSVRVLDAIIHQTTNYYFEETKLEKRYNEKRKQGYRNKKVLIKMKRKGK